MNFKMKPLHMAAVAALAVVIIALVVLFSGSTEKQVREQYDAFKSDLGLSDIMQEDDVHYSLFSRTLVVDNPTIKLSTDIPGLTNQFSGAGVEAMVKGLMGMMDAGLSQLPQSALNSSFMRAFDALNMTERVALSFEAKELRLKRSGDNKDGEMQIEFKGISLSRPYLTTIANELVSPLDNPDELSPGVQLDRSGNGIATHRWYHNAVNKLPGSGSFLVDSMGLYGATLDASIHIERSSGGEGEMLVTLIHRVDGSEVGRIERKAEFAKLPELDEVGQVAEAYLKGYALMAMGSRAGVMVSGAAGEKFLRDSKLKSYDLKYKGYGDLEALVPGADGKYDEKVTKTCARTGLSARPLTEANKAKVKIDDSNCAIAVSLIKDGTYEEAYRFNEDKSAFSELMVNEGYTVEVN